MFYKEELNPTVHLMTDVMEGSLCPRIYLGWSWNSLPIQKTGRSSNLEKCHT